MAKAKIKDYGINVTSNDKAVVFIEFETLETLDKDTYVWTGWLTTEKSIQRILDTLKTCGFNGSIDDVVNLADGIDSKSLDTSRFYDIKTSVETDENGKIRYVAEYVNEFKQKPDKEILKQKLSSIIQNAKSKTTTQTTTKSEQALKELPF
jgi:hypothetical protein